MSETRFKIVYCSIANLDAARWSWIVTPPTGIVYYPGRWTTAPFGGLLVWAEEYKAERRAFEEQWKVEVEEQVPLPSCRLRFVAWLTPSEIFNLARRLWEGEKLDPVYLEEWPAGTEAWRRVKLVERLE
jgi:hypothetical protein